MSLLHCQEQGQGSTPLLCLHSSGASGGQWRTVAEHLHPRRRVLTVDLLGHGRSPGWPSQAPDSLAIEADAVWSTVGDVELDLVGHSYGGAVALQMALERPERVRSLCLYEPVLFGLLRRYEPWGEAWQEISALAGRLERLLAARQPEAASAMFCDYWADAPAWQGFGPQQRQALAQRMPTVARHFRALFEATWGPREMLRLTMPVRLFCGGRTRVPARRVCELLELALGRVRLDHLPEAGHLGPISHAQTFGALLAQLQPRHAQACA